MRRILFAAAAAVASFPVATCWLLNRAKTRHGFSVLCSSSTSKSDLPYNYGRPRPIDENLIKIDDRPGAIIESEQDEQIKNRILEEIDSGARQYPAYFDDYGTTQDEEAEYDIDDPDAIDAGTLGTWNYQDLKSKFSYEWDPLSDDPDPNVLELQQPFKQFSTKELDEQGVEVGYDPFFGDSNPFDDRTIEGSVDSFMIDETTRDETMLTPLFPDKSDPEVEYNQDVVEFRKSLKILETYVDPFLQAEVPRHVAKWHGYPQPIAYPPKNATNNLFTGNPTDFDSMTPYDARRKAVELARSKNAEWLPDGVSQDFHRTIRQPYEDYGTNVGTLRRGECDPHVVQQMRPVLNILGSCVELLSIDNDNTIFRFKYHGLMKNKYGMECWTRSMLENVGLQVNNVIFETGFRRRDPAYDGGDHWNGPVSF